MLSTLLLNVMFTSDTLTLCSMTASRCVMPFTQPSECIYHWTHHSCACTCWRWWNVHRLLVLPCLSSSCLSVSVRRKKIIFGNPFTSKYLATYWHTWRKYPWKEGHLEYNWFKSTLMFVWLSIETDFIGNKRQTSGSTYIVYEWSTNNQWWHPVPTTRFLPSR